MKDKLFDRIFEPLFIDIFTSLYSQNYIDLIIRDDNLIPITENDGTPITFPKEYYDE